MDLRYLLSLIALLGGAVASGVLLLRTSPEDVEADVSPRLGLGYYLKGAQLTGTGDDGLPLYRMSARTASQSLTDGTVDMLEVQMIYEPVTNVPWDVRADAGHLPPDGNIIQLSGNVVAVAREGDQPATTIRTDYLELDPDTSIAETQSKVTVDYAGNRIFATGMRVYFKEDRLQLKSNVNSKFVP